jgi:hypothetical protein
LSALFLESEVLTGPILIIYEWIFVPVMKPNSKCVLDIIDRIS